MRGFLAAWLRCCCCGGGAVALARCELVTSAPEIFAEISLAPHDPLGGREMAGFVGSPHFQPSEYSSDTPGDRFLLLNPIFREVEPDTAPRPGARLCM